MILRRGKTMPGKSRGSLDSCPERMRGGGGGVVLKLTRKKATATALGCKLTGGIIRPKKNNRSIKEEIEVEKGVRRWSWPNPRG